MAAVIRLLSNSTGVAAYIYMIQMQKSMPDVSLAEKLTERALAAPLSQDKLHHKCGPR